MALDARYLNMPYVGLDMNQLASSCSIDVKYENEDPPYFDIGHFTRSEQDFEDIKSRTYKGGFAVDLTTNMRPVHQLVKEHADFLMWNLHKSVTAQSQIHLQMMELETDLYLKADLSYRPPVQNHMKGAA